MMIMAANNFVFITLNIFSLIKLYMTEGSDVAMLCANIVTGTVLYSLIIYFILHMAHFTRSEVRHDKSRADERRGYREQLLGINGNKV